MTADDTGGEPDNVREETKIRRARLMRERIKEWIRRYLPMEVLALVALLFAAWSVRLLTGNEIIIAYATVLGENVGYYGFAVVREFMAQHKKEGASIPRATARGVRNVFLEFGPAEILDSFVVRPFAMYIFPILMGNVALGVILGKICADLVFYIPVVISRELLKRRFRG